MNYTIILKSGDKLDITSDPDLLANFKDAMALKPPQDLTRSMLSFDDRYNKCTAVVLLSEVAAIVKETK